MTLVSDSSTPVALDISVTAPRMYLVNNGPNRIEASADFHLGGTFERPSFTGSLEKIIAGEFLAYWQPLFCA